MPFTHSHSGRTINSRLINKLLSPNSIKVYAAIRMSPPWSSEALLTTRKAAWYIISVVPVGLSVCLSNDNFWKPWRSKFLFAHAVYLHEIRVKFVTSHMKVICGRVGSMSLPQELENSHSRNVKLRSAITVVL